MRIVAALFVRAGGVYYGRADVDPWDEARDARTGQRHTLGDDGGCFEAALAAARRWVGVIEHPQGSRAWDAFGLARPPREGGWVAADWHGGRACRVEQGRYGHHAAKPTWLLAYHFPSLPDLDWGVSPPWQPPPELVARIGLARAKRRGAVGARGGGRDSPARTYTPEPFAALLIRIARTASPPQEIVV